MKVVLVQCGGIACILHLLTSDKSVLLTLVLPASTPHYPSLVWWRLDYTVTAYTYTWQLSA